MERLKVIFTVPQDELLLPGSELRLRDVESHVNTLQGEVDDLENRVNHLESSVNVVKIDDANVSSSTVYSSRRVVQLWNDKLDRLYPSSFDQTVTTNIGQFKVGDSLSGLTIAQIIEKILCSTSSPDEPPVDPPVDPPVEPTGDTPTFLGLIAFKSVSEITYDDLNVSTVEQNTVVKPQSTYAHSGSLALSKSAIIAFPKTFGSIDGVVDAAGVSLTGSYEWLDVTLTIPDVGDVEYVIGGAKKAQMYNSSSVVTWNIS